MPLSFFFVKCCCRVGNEMKCPVKETSRNGSINWTKKMETHLPTSLTACSGRRSTWWCASPTRPRRAYLSCFFTRGSWCRWRGSACRRNLSHSLTVRWMTFRSDQDDTCHGRNQRPSAISSHRVSSWSGSAEPFFTLFFSSTLCAEQRCEFCGRIRLATTCRVKRKMVTKRRFQLDKKKEGDAHPLASPVSKSVRTFRKTKTRVRL